LEFRWARSSVDVSFTSVATRLLTEVSWLAVRCTNCLFFDPSWGTPGNVISVGIAASPFSETGLKTYQGIGKEQVHQWF